MVGGLPSNSVRFAEARTCVTPAQTGTFPAMSIGDAEAFREAIIGASLELGQAYGEDGVTMRAIASKLGTSATTLYTCFESKAAIMRELRLRGLQSIGRSILAALDIADPRESLLEATRRYISFARDNPWLYQLLMITETIVTDVVTDEQRGVLQNMYSDPQGVGQRFLKKYEDVTGHPPEDPNAVFAHWWSAVHGVCALAITRRLRADHPVVPIGDLDKFIDDYACGIVDWLLR
jgi:AcrR family transcriptional regulator